MNSIRTAVVVSAGLIVALWWSVMPPRSEPRSAAPVAQSRQQQCPGGSKLDGKLCVCPAASSWTGTQCAPSATDRGADARRHVTTVDLRQR